MLNTLPVIVSPTTSRLGFKTALISKDSLDSVSGDLNRPFKYDIPPVDLKKCDQGLDFACLLAIGTTPFSIQSKQLDGLDKTINLRSVRFTGTANYAITPGLVSRGAIELIPDKMPRTLELQVASVTIRASLIPLPSLDPVDFTLLNKKEGTNGAYVYANGGIIKDILEGEQSTIARIKIDSRIVKSSLEKQIQLAASVKIDNGLVSPTANLIVREGTAVVAASIKIAGGLTTSSIENNNLNIATIRIDDRQVATTLEPTALNQVAIKIDDSQIATSLETTSGFKASVKTGSGGQVSTSVEG
jgi:hypothetical protein